VSGRGSPNGQPSRKQLGTRISAQDTINDLDNILYLLGDRAGKLSVTRPKGKDTSGQPDQFVFGEEVARRVGGFTFGHSPWLRSHSRVRRGQGGSYMNGRTVDYDFIKRQEKATQYGNRNLRRKGKPIPIPRAYTSRQSEEPNAQPWNSELDKITDVHGNVKFRDITIQKSQCGCYMVIAMLNTFGSLNMCTQAGPVIDEDISLMTSQAKDYGNSQAAQFWKRRHKEGMEHRHVSTKPKLVALEQSEGGTQDVPPQLDTFSRLAERKLHGEAFEAMNEQTQRFMREIRYQMLQLDFLSFCIRACNFFLLL
jgi:hypothetical protein